MEYHLLRRGGRAVAGTEEWGGELANSKEKRPASALGMQDKGCLLGQLAKPHATTVWGCELAKEQAHF